MVLTQTSYPMIGFIHETSVVSNSSNNQVGYGTGVAYVPSGSFIFRWFYFCLWK
jgi:hypothetical protein